MKRLLAFLWLITMCITSKAQQDSIVVLLINSIPKEGTMLDKGWKFHKGDDAAWSQRDFDDSRWQTINPSLDIREIPQLQKGIGWFRLKIFINDKVRQRPLSLTIDQRGASEIYVNGMLIYKFGVVSANPKKIVAYMPGNQIFGKPFLFPFDKDSIYTIAVRYALQPSLLYTANTNWSNPVFKSRLNYLHQAINLYKDENRHWTGTSVFLMGCFFYTFYTPFGLLPVFPFSKSESVFQFVCAICNID